jgi:hypothetical protein
MIDGGKNPFSTCQIVLHHLVLLHRFSTRNTVRPIRRNGVVFRSAAPHYSGAQ